MDRLTEKDIEDLQDAGRDWARGWVYDRGNPEEFDGQSEAMDLALGWDELCSVGTDEQVSVAEYIYEGMRKEIEDAKAGRGYWAKPILPKQPPWAAGGTLEVGGSILQIVKDHKEPNDG